MAFKKDTRQAGDVAKELRGAPIGTQEGNELLLKSFTLRASGKFGQLAVLQCEDEEGNEVKLSTFSEIIVSQLEDIEDELPLLITPRKVSNYYTIF